MMLGRASACMEARLARMLTRYNTASSRAVLPRAAARVVLPESPAARPRLPERQRGQCLVASASGGEAERPRASATAAPFVIVNFYHLCDIWDPEAELAEHRRFMAGRDIAGRIYISWQGINAQYSGPMEDAHAYAEWVASRPGFSGLAWRTERVPAQMFPRLKLKFRQSLISMAGGTKHLNVGKPGYLPEHLEPRQWKEMIRAAQQVKSGGPVSSGTLPPAVADQLQSAALKDIVVMDLRNDYEWDVGHFVGADRPKETMFNETPTDKSSGEMPAPLQGRDPETPVMMYCTGGIRCDVYAAYLKEKGFKNVYALKGGVHNYFIEEGGDEWKGSLFVFDGRVAVPAEHPEEAERRWRTPETAGSLEGVTKGQVDSSFALGAASPFKGLKAATGCYVCGGKAEAPHINCANIDCNRLFLACPRCKETMRGCCCKDCIGAPRLLRPLTEGNYGRWTAYADEGLNIKELRRQLQAEGREEQVNSTA